MYSAEQLPRCDLLRLPLARGFVLSARQDPRREARRRSAVHTPPRSSILIFFLHKSRNSLLPHERGDALPAIFFPSFLIFFSQVRKLTFAVRLPLVAGRDAVIFLFIYFSISSFFSVFFFPSEFKDRLLPHEQKITVDNAKIGQSTPIPPPSWRA